MSAPNQFRHFQIVQDGDGGNVELVRNADQVAVLAFDHRNLEFVQCHVLLRPLADRGEFDFACGKLRKNGHPLMARMVEFGEDEGNPYYITGCVDGETLRAYVARQTEIPLWLAVTLACRALEAVTAVCERGDYLMDQPMDSLRIVQTGPRAVQVMVADYRLPTQRARQRATKSNLDRQARFLTTFLQEHAGSNPTSPDILLPAGDLGELLGGCLTAASPDALDEARELRANLLKLAPEHLSGEIPAAQKPRALVAPLLASYQEVARGVVNLVRIQSQRLDVTNPYTMRGTLTRTGRQVMVEEVPPARICGARVGEVDRALFKMGRKRDAALMGVALVNETDDITCVAEETVEGVSLAELMRERSGLDVQEAYLVLAGLDAALTQVEKAFLATRKIRLEDVYLLTGFSREDPRTARLLVSRLNEWPAFSLLVRAHPTLASMSGRGTDPGCLVPANGDSHARSPWSGTWMAAVCRFLLAIEGANGKSPRDAGGREFEAVAQLIGEELAKARDGQVNTRSDFLGRYARIVQHLGVIRVSPAAKPGQDESVDADDGAELAGGLLSVAPEAIDPVAEKPSVGFAEILFQSSGGKPVPSAETQWPKSPAGTWTPDPAPVPMWLKAAVFVGGSMVVGGVLAHVSGEAFWQKGRSMAQPAPAAESGVLVPVRRAVPVPDESVSDAAPPVVIPDEAPSGVPPSSLSLKPPSGGALREILTNPENQADGSGAIGMPPR